MTEVGDEEYNDLDELIARYAEPYMRNVEAVTKHRCAFCAWAAWRSCDRAFSCRSQAPPVPNAWCTHAFT